MSHPGAKMHWKPACAQSALLVQPCAPASTGAQPIKVQLRFPFDSHLQVLQPSPAGHDSPTSQRRPSGNVQNIGPSSGRAPTSDALPSLVWLASPASLGVTDAPQAARNAVAMIAVARVTNDWRDIGNDSMTGDARVWLNATHERR